MYLHQRHIQYHEIFWKIRFMTIFCVQILHCLLRPRMSTVFLSPSDPCGGWKWRIKTRACENKLTCSQVEEHSSCPITTRLDKCLFSLHTVATWCYHFSLNSIKSSLRLLENYTVLRWTLTFVRVSHKSPPTAMTARIYGCEPLQTGIITLWFSLNISYYCQGKLFWSLSTNLSKFVLFFLSQSKPKCRGQSQNTLIVASLPLSWELCQWPCLPHALQILNCEGGQLFSIEFNGCTL